MPVKGHRELKRNLNSFAEDVKIKMPEQTITAVLQIGAQISRKYAPIEYSTLVNSVRQTVKNVGGNVVGTLGYYTSYAHWLNFNPDWSPRPPERKQGPAWNPNATPHFLEAGFTSSEAKRAIKSIIKEVNEV